MTYKPIRPAIHNFAHSFCSTLNYLQGDYALYHLARAARAAVASEVRVRWIAEGRVLVPTAIELAIVGEGAVAESLAAYAARWPSHRARMHLSLRQLRRVDMRLSFAWAHPGPRGPLTLTMEAEDDRGRTYVVAVEDFSQEGMLG